LQQGESVPGPRPQEVVLSGREQLLHEVGVAQRLADARRQGAEPRLSPEQACQMIALACEQPNGLGRPISHWTTASWPTTSCVEESPIASHRAMRRGCSKSADLQPHRIRSWLTPAADADRETKIADVCGVDRSAVERAQDGQRTVSTDELTHIQALERLALNLPPRPGQVARRAFEYKRRGTCSFFINFINFDVATGQVFSPSSGAPAPTLTSSGRAGDCHQ
jgi:hypothetical protein